MFPLPTNNISGYRRFFITIFIIQIIDIVICDSSSSCYIGIEFSAGNLTLSEGDRNRTWLNRQRPLPAGKLTAYSLKATKVSPSTPENSDLGIWLLIWRPLESNQVTLIWKKSIPIKRSSEIHIKATLGDDSPEVQRGDLYGWTSNGDVEIALQYLHGNFCYQLVYDENKVNIAVDVNKEKPDIHHTAICYPAEFDLGVFVDTAEDGCKGFGLIDDNKIKPTNKANNNTNNRDSNNTNVSKAVGNGSKTDPDSNILSVNLIVIYFVVMLH